MNINLQWRFDSSSSTNYSNSYGYVILSSNFGNRVNIVFHGTTSNTMSGDDLITYPLTVIPNKEELYYYHMTEEVDYNGNSIWMDGTPSSFDLYVDNKVVLSKQQLLDTYDLLFLNEKSYAVDNYLINFSVSRTK